MPLWVLIVEHEVAVQELHALNLENAGHQVLRAENAEHALTNIRQTLLDLVLFAMLKHGKNYKQRAIPVQFSDDIESASQCHRNP